MFRKKIKESKGVSGTAAKPKWIYFEALSFLIPMMKSRATSGNLPVSDTPSTQHSEEHGEASYTENDLDLSTEHDEHFDEPEEVTEGGNVRQPKNTSTITTNPEGSKPQRPGSKRKQAPSIQNEALDLERRKVQLMEARFATPQTNTSLEDDDLSFFKSLLPSLKKLSDIRRMKLRSTILNCVIAELETVQETNRTWPSTTGTTQPPRCPSGSGYYSNPYGSSSDTSSSIPSPYHHQNSGQGELPFFSKNTRSVSNTESWTSPNNQVESLTDLY